MHNKKHQNCRGGARRGKSPITSEMFHVSRNLGGMVHRTKRGEAVGDFLRAVGASQVRTESGLFCQHFLSASSLPSSELRGRITAQI